MSTETFLIVVNQFDGTALCKRCAVEPLETLVKQIQGVTRRLEENAIERSDLIDLKAQLLAQLSATAKLSQNKAGPVPTIVPATLHIVNKDSTEGQVKRGWKKIYTHAPAPPTPKPPTPSLPTTPQRIAEPQNGNPPTPPLPPTCLNKAPDYWSKDLKRKFEHQQNLSILRRAQHKRLNVHVAQDSFFSVNPSSSSVLLPPNVVLEENVLPQVRPCQKCEIKVAQFTCAACQNRLYCSRSCQLSDWAFHEYFCS